MPIARSARFGQLLAIFALSGFSGLIYQSIWSHYLGLTLGHAAYAQTLVLSIFMGGLALGSWLASRWTRHIANALLAYAGIELLIGVFGLAFHPGFVAYTGFSQEVALPALATGVVRWYQWGTAAVLILPQCVLLGMTFPLMAAACLRTDPAAQGRSLGGLYFSNSLGAALGALLATFLLLPRIGMPGAMLVAGAINLLVAALAWQLSRAPAQPAAPSANARANAKAETAKPERATHPHLRAIVLVAVAITGATSFVYEVVWVRMLNLALGTTLHSFELMLTAFILGLATGAWWIHRRGDATANTLRLAGVAQVLMGLCALASALAFGQSFHAVAWLMQAVPRTDAGYGWFNFGSATIALLVMFPAAFFAGSTLPLFTMSLLRRGHGERAVGWVYAANTLGAILGVLAVVHLLIPGLGLHLSLLLAAALDVALGVALLALFGAASAPRDMGLGLVAGMAMFAVALVFGRVDPLVASSGVYRNARLIQPDEARIEFMADGKTSTVTVFATADGEALTIATNGKPDAGLSPLMTQAPVGDEVMMLMIGALPLALHEDPRDVAVVGWGSGLTTHTLLGSPRVRRVQTVEIEPAMVRGARRFGERVARAYGDPRSQIVYDDARTWLSASGTRYDVLVSEPSNPWVSGVASLFTEEYYHVVGRHLQPRGIFVQWLQAYEISDALQARMVGALLKRFAHVDVYLAGSTDLAFVASASPLPALDMRRLAHPPLDSELARVGLKDETAFRMRRLGGREVLAAYVRMNDGEAGHSDFYPEVALHAPRDRFTDQFAAQLRRLALNGMPVLDLVDGRRVPRLDELAHWDNESSIVRYQLYAGWVGAAFNHRSALEKLRGKEARVMARLLAASSALVASSALPQWSDDLAVLARFGPGVLAPEDAAHSWIEAKWLAPGQGPEVNAVMAAYRAAAQRDAAAMRANAVEVLELDAGLAAGMREQMLVIAMLGAAGERDMPGLRALDRRYGGALALDDEMGRVRQFLLAWSWIAGAP